MLVKVFASPSGSEFTLFEDDGQTIAYQSGQVRETRISQQQQNPAADQHQATLVVESAQGSYQGAPDSRNNVIQLITAIGNRPATGTGVTLDGAALAEHTTRADFEAADAGWFNDQVGKAVWVKSGVKPVAERKEFIVQLASSSCTSEYASISVPGEGNGWNPADPERTLQCSGENVWKGQIKLCAEAFKFAADGSWARNWGANGEQDGPNFEPLADSGLFEVTFNEADPAQPVFTLLDSNPAICASEGVSAAFVCKNGLTNQGTSVYVVGNIPQLANWNTDDAIKLEPTGPYPTWQGTIPKLPAETQIEWKCIKRLETGNPPSVLEWEPGDNNAFMTPATGNAGQQEGAF